VTDSNESPPTHRGRLPFRYVVRRTATEFSRDQCTDLAAALTYYSVLSIFPATIALVSLLGVIGESERTLTTALEVLEPLLSDSVLGFAEEILRQVTQTPAAGAALLIGVAASLWSASGYVGAFSRAMNRIYGVDEGRPFWMLRPAMLLITAATLLLLLALVLMLVVSGPVAESIGQVVGLGPETLRVWDLAKLPIVTLVAILVVALLYYATPNVRLPKFRWLSGGAAVAIVIGYAAAQLCAFYLSNLANYNRTYGSLAGVIGALLLLWLVNIALLVGAEFDAELTRGRQLQAGVAAEERVQLAPRSTRASTKGDEKYAALIAEGREIRQPDRADDSVQ
jgi:membrane protein